MEIDSLENRWFAPSGRPFGRKEATREVRQDELREPNEFDIKMLSRDALHYEGVSITGGRLLPSELMIGAEDEETGMDAPEYTSTLAAVRPRTWYHRLAAHPMGRLACLAFVMVVPLLLLCAGIVGASGHPVETPTKPTEAPVTAPAVPLPQPAPAQPQTLVNRANAREIDRPSRSRSRRNKARHRRHGRSSRRSRSSRS